MPKSPSVTRLEPHGSRASFLSHPGRSRSRDRVVQIGRYRLASLIAVGGMGSIHFGVLTGAAEFSRLVAIKRLHPQLAEDPLFRVRFIEEARLNARVLHPNVAQLLDVVEAEDELWLIMEYVDGATLHCLQREIAAARRLLPLDVVSGVVGAVLEGLHAAHETSDTSGAPLRIVHRDVSPQNIMISRSGQVKVIDFGIAKATAPTAESTLGRLVGKVSYMSPEQASGVAVDQRSDLFAAGVVLWEALTGQRLFRQAKQSHASILRDVLRKPVPAPSEHRAEISSALDAVVLRALARNPSDRFSSAREFAQALDAAVPGASGSRISAYVTVFCEAAAGPPHGLSPTKVPSRQSAVTQVPGDDDERTLLALTGSSGPPPHVVSPTVWHRRFGRYDLSLAFVVCCVAALGWATRLPRSTTEHSTGASVASPARAHGAAPATPTASFAAPPPSPSPPPVAVTVLADVGTAATLGKTTKQRTPRPRAARAASAIKQAATVTAPARQRAATAKPLPPERDDCSSPTYLGQDGIQHFKDECL
jgi:eukaryotic-like serine/threonine-protein kinase